MTDDQACKTDSAANARAGGPTGSSLATVALALALLSVLPFLPVIGVAINSLVLAVLPVAAVALLLGATAFLRQRRASRGIPLAAMIIAAVGLVTHGSFLLWGLTRFNWDHLLGRPHFEATAELDRMMQLIDRYAGSHQGTVPAGRTARTPRDSCCSGPTSPSCRSTPQDWQDPIWRTIGFEKKGKHYFSYRYQSDGKTIAIEASGDLDCDGELSSYRFKGKLEGGTVSFKGPYIENEIE